MNDGYKNTVGRARSGENMVSRSILWFGFNPLARRWLCLEKGKEKAEDYTRPFKHLYTSELIHSCHMRGGVFTGDPE